MSDVSTAYLVIAIIEALLRQGPQVVVKIASLFENGEPTAEDIRKLYISKKPEDYFR